MGRVKSGARTPPAKSIHQSVLRAEGRCKFLSRSTTAKVAGLSPASSNSGSEGEALVLESPLSGSLSMNSSAAEAVIFIRLAPISFDENSFETTSAWLYHEPLLLAAS